MTGEGPSAKAVSLAQAGMPLEVKGILSYFNVPVDPSPSAEHNPLRTLKALTRPQDFVVLKIDIDNTPVRRLRVATLDSLCAATCTVCLSPRGSCH